MEKLFPFYKSILFLETVGQNSNDQAENVEKSGRSCKTNANFPVTEI